MDLEVNKEINLVKKLLHLEDNSKVAFIDMGWTSRVYVVDGGKFVAKFPRNDATKKEYIREFAILKLLEKIRLEVLIPHIYMTHKNNNYLIYKGIVGEALDNLSKELDNKSKHTVGEKLGRFLKHLHGIQLDGASTMTVDDEITQFQDKYEQGKTVLYDTLSSSEKDKLYSQVYSIIPYQLKEFGYDKALCHGDLGYWNMIISTEGEIGIIDFGDIGYWDKSKDFIGMEDSTILDEALRVYGDNLLMRQKIKVRQKILTFLDLPFYLGKYDSEGISKTIKNIRLMLSK